jgi:hypothetical protein
MPRPEQEDIQTSHDANLFDDDMEDNMEHAANIQTPTQVETPAQVDHSLARMTRMDKREASRMDIDGATEQPPTGPDKKEKLKTVRPGV